MPRGTLVRLTKGHRREVGALHERCGIYTSPKVVCRILDAVGWRVEADLSRSCLLEPAAGNGAFIVEAARRLVAAFLHHRIRPNTDNLLHRITAFELHPRESRLARQRLIATLCSAGVHARTAKVCARSWVVNGDFLLADLATGSFTHAVGNPPYVRWPKIPRGLKDVYEKRLPRDMTGGDLFLPFLNQALELLRPGGSCGFLCSDRWRFMAFAERFRNKWLPRLDVKSEQSVPALEAFVDKVDSYPTILIASKKAAKRERRPVPKFTNRKTLEELGCIVKVGPALGHAPAYVLAPDEDDVEPELLQQWVDGTEISDGKLNWRGRRVIVMYGKDEELLDLKRFPLLTARLTRFKKALKNRSIVAKGAPWFRPIDRVIVASWSRPKLLVPELAKVPRLAIDRSGAIPSHGVYSIFAPDDDVDALYDKLRDGKLAAALTGIAPKVKGGYVRCYRRFLLKVRVEK